MGTHPIFESDFDCLTERANSKKENMNEIIYKIEKDINTIKIIDGKLYFGASDFNVYKRDEKGVFSSVIKHEAQVTALGEFKGDVVSAGLDGRVRFTDGSSFISQMPVIRCMSITSDGKGCLLFS